MIADAVMWKKTDAGVNTEALSRTHHSVLLISPYVYSLCKTAERTHSVPVMGTAFAQKSSNRPKTTPSNAHAQNFSSVFK